MGWRQSGEMGFLLGKGGFPKSSLTQAALPVFQPDPVGKEDCVDEYQPLGFKPFLCRSTYLFQYPSCVPRVEQEQDLKF